MRIAILGGTGPTGRLLLARALAAGHTVRALSRREPQSGPITGLEWVRGDACDPAAIASLVAGCDAVLSTLGPGPESPPSFCADSTRVLVDAARSAGVRSLIVVTGAMIGHEVLGPFYRWLRARPGIARTLADRREQERLVRESGLAWTLVRPPRLANGTPPGGRHVGSDVPIGWLDRAVRADVADAMLEALGGTHVREGITVVSTLGAGNPRRALASWVARVALAEFLGIWLCASVAAGWNARFGEPSSRLGAWAFYAAMLCAGAAEGALLGWLPSRVLSSTLPGFDRKTFARNTTLVALAAWAIGMLPSTMLSGTATASSSSGPPTGPMALAGLLGGLLGGTLIGLAQRRAFARTAERGRGWVNATAVGWALGLSLDMIGATLPDAGDPIARTLALGAGFGLLAGVAVALPTGWLLGRWLRRGRGAESARDLAVPRDGGARKAFVASA